MPSPTHRPLGKKHSWGTAWQKHFSLTPLSLALPICISPAQVRPWEPKGLHMRRFLLQESDLSLACLLLPRYWSEKPSGVTTDPTQDTHSLSHSPFLQVDRQRPWQRGARVTSHCTATLPHSALNAAPSCRGQECLQSVNIPITTPRASDPTAESHVSCAVVWPRPKRKGTHEAA